MTEEFFEPFLQGDRDKTSDCFADSFVSNPEYGVLLDKFADPFLGSGKMLFKFLAIPGMSSFHVSDFDRELINAYKQVRDFPDDITEEITLIKKHFYNRTSEKRAEFCHSLRLRFNYLSEIGDSKSSAERAALYIFNDSITSCDCLSANKSKGCYTEAPEPLLTLCSERNLKLCSTALSRVEITCCDFRECLSKIDCRTVLYLNPPPVGYKKGTPYAFTENDMKSVMSICKIAKSFGAEVLSDI